MTPGSLYVVSTPIGNLEDITYRAVRVLGECDRILAEDTRRTGVLLRTYGISTRLVSAHEHNEEGRATQVLGWLAEGERIAIVSDAGTPLLSDPGARIVASAIEAGYSVTPIPGPSALLAALVVSGVSADTFRFLGFPSRRRTERDALLDEVAASSETVVLYEAPTRLLALLDALEERIGSRTVAIARELTKMHEEVVRGSVHEVRARWDDDDVRGEIVVVIEGASRIEGEPDAADLQAAHLLGGALFAQGMRHKEVVRELRRRLGLARNDAYAIASAEREKGETSIQPERDRS